MTIDDEGNIVMAQQGGCGHTVGEQSDRVKSFLDEAAAALHLGRRICAGIQKKTVKGLWQSHEPAYCWLKRAKVVLPPVL
jgi:hypothetical protein